MTLATPSPVDNTASVHVARAERAVEAIQARMAESGQWYSINGHLTRGFELAAVEDALNILADRA